MWPQSTTADHKCWAQTQAAPDKREKVKKHRVDNKIHVELRYSRHAVYVMRINTPTVMYLREKILFGVNKRCFFLWHVYVCAAAVFVSSWASLFLFSDGEERTRMAALRRAPIRSSRFYSSISFCSINNDGTTIRRLEMDIIMSSTYVSWCCLTLKSSALPGGILDKLSFRQVALRSFIREKNTVVTHLWKEHCGHSSVKRTLWSLICETNTVVTHLWKEHCGHSSVKRTLWSLICERTLWSLICERTLWSLIREKNNVVTHLWKEHCGHSSVKNNDCGHSSVKEHCGHSSVKRTLWSHIRKKNTVVTHLWRNTLESGICEWENPEHEDATKLSDTPNARPVLQNKLSNQSMEPTVRLRNTCCMCTE